MSYELSIVVVNWNGGDFLIRCLASILRNAPSVPFETVIVDNASTDSSLNLLRESLSCVDRGSIRTIENEANIGFARACNQGILSSDSPFVFLLNPDTEVRAGAIDALVNCLKADDGIGACAPRLINSDGFVQPNCWANVPYPLFFLLNDLKLSRLVPRAHRARLLLGTYWDHSERRDVSSFSGAAIMARRKMIDDVGAFDESFHMYGEDAEWCYRIVRSGWRLFFEPAAEVVHLGGQSASQRWSDADRRLREVEANLQFQRHILSPLQVMTNTLLDTTFLSALRARDKMRKRPVQHFSDLIDLKMSYFKRSLRDIFRRNPARR